MAVRLALFQQKSAEKRTKNDELEYYLHIGIEDVEDGNLLSYQRNNSQRWPTLAVMARDYLAIPSSSAVRERPFSLGRDIIGLNRHSLQSTTMEASVTLRSWLRSGLLDYCRNAEYKFFIIQINLLFQMVIEFKLIILITNTRGQRDKQTEKHINITEKPQFDQVPFQFIAKDAKKDDK